MVDKHDDFVISESSYRFTIENIKANDFDNFHTHIRKRKSKKKKTQTCDMLINLVCSMRVPKSDYLRVSAKRISRNKKYIEMIEHKEMKDKNKQKFFKVNNGIF